MFFFVKDTLLQSTCRIKRSQHREVNFKASNISDENATKSRQILQEALSQPDTLRLSRAFDDLMSMVFKEVCVEDSCPEIEAETSNGRLSEKNLKSHVIECENDLEMLSFQLLPNTSDVERTNNLSDFLAFVNRKMEVLNAQFEADSLPLFPFNTVDGNNRSWYHLHRDWKTPNNLKNKLKHIVIRLVVSVKTFEVFNMKEPISKFTFDTLSHTRHIFSKIEEDQGW